MQINKSSKIQVTEGQIYNLIREAGISEKEQRKTHESILSLLAGGESAQNIAIQGFQDIEKLKRFRGIPMVSTDMVGEHQDRVTRMILFSQHLISLFAPEFDFQKATFIAQYHDVSEGISPLGDIPTNIKEGLSIKSQEILNQIEMACIEILSSLEYTSYYGKKDTVREIFLDGFEKKSLESWIMKWFDLIDAYMVTIHEILHGNEEAFFPIYKRYQSIMSDILTGKRYPEIGKFLTSIHQEKYHTFMKELFEGELYDYYVQSFHLFDIKKLAMNIKNGEQLNPPLCYLTWLRFYIPSEYNRIRPIIK